MKSAVLDFVSDLAGTVASHLPPRLGAAVDLPALQFQSSEPEVLQRHVPRKLDLHYITDRIIGMAQPAEAAFPTRVDQGRDADSGSISVEHDMPSAQGTNAPISEEPDENEMMLSAILDESLHSEKCGVDPAHVEGVSTTTSSNGPDEDDLPLTGAMAEPNPNEPDENDGAPMELMLEAGSPVEEPPVVPCSNEPDENDFPPRADMSQPITPEPQNDDEQIEVMSEATTPDEESTAASKAKDPAEKPRPIFRKQGNSPATLSTFLSRRHPKRYLAVNVSDEEADDRTLLLLNRQIIRFPWLSPCIKKSETPFLPQLLEICYAIHAYLSLDDDNVLLVYCANGKTRTAIVVACYLKFSGVVQNALDGFRLFVRRRCPDLDSSTISDHIPPSLKTFFRNFNDCVELGGYANPKPLLLRAVALQGVPVDDKPCIDIWDSQQRHVYSSNPEFSLDPTTYDEEDNQNQLMTSQWADEEGFYRVNKVLAGDFVLLCRFGGPYADDYDDPSKVLFRYANTSGFLCSGPYELPKGKVDMTRRYDTSFDEEDFLLTIMFDSCFDNVAAEEFAVLRRPCPESVLPRVIEQSDAIERGFNIISERHVGRPVARDVELVTPGEVGDGFSAIVAKVSLQLANHDVTGAQALFSKGMKATGKQNTIGSKSFEPEIGLSSQESGDKESLSGGPPLTDVPELTSEDACSSVLRLLDEVDLGDQREWIDRVDEEFHHGRGPRTKEVKEESTRRTRSTDPLVALYNPIMMPSRGDVVDAFGSYHVQSQTQPFRRFGAPPQSLEHGVRPRMPVHSGRKRPRRSIDDSVSVNDRHHGSETRVRGSRGKKAPRVSHGDLVYDVDTASAVEMLLKLSHTGVTLDDLRSLREASRRWAAGGDVSRVSGGESTEVDGTTLSMKSRSIPETETPSGAVNGDSSTSGGRASSADVAALHVIERQSKTLPGIEAAAAPLARSKNREKIETKEGASTTNAEGSPEVQKGKDATGASEQSETRKDEGARSNAEPVGDPPLKDDPEYAKYFNMLKMGLPMDVAKHAMTRDGKDPTIIELDPEQSLNSQRKVEKIETDDLPLREDPEYRKYFKMLKMGLPEGAVRNALQRDGKDPSIMDLDPDKSLKSQRGGGLENDGPPLRDDPEYSKYFKMLKMGLPEGAVRNALQRDGKDPGIMDLDPDKSLKSQQGGTKKEDDGPPLKDDPEYSKYFKMLKMGLPEGAVRNALQRDGKDPEIMDLDPGKSLKAQQEGGQEDAGPPLKDDPEYSKYFKMLKMGLPEGAVRNALQRDGKDPGIMDLDPDKSLKSQQDGEQEEDDGPALKDDPEFAKYFKMLKMLLPMGAVKQALMRDGKDPTILDLDHSKSLKSQVGREAKDDGPALQDDPEFSKYFKMLKMLLPMGAVKNALQRDGKDPSILDLDPSKSLASQKNSAKRRKLSKKEKKAVRRKKIYWTPLDEKKLTRESIWSLVQGTVNMEQLKYDMKEFENLFTESSNPADRKKKAKSGAEKSGKPKKSIQVIDGKRGMNGGIILARLKIEYRKLAEMVDSMESKQLDATQLRALKEFLPTDEERAALTSYLKKSEGSEEARKTAMAALSECEKYMVAMLDVRIADAKFDCMLFKYDFESRLEELNEARNTVKKACDEVRSSERLRKMMAMILTLVNQINTGGESGKMAVGFSLDALLKLNEAKAFDKKTSVLHYLAKLVLENDKTLLKFHEDIPSVGPAEGVMLDGLVGDIKALSQELENVNITAKEEADRAEGKVDSEQSSENHEGQKESRTSGAVDSPDGRTPMERFTRDAEKAVEEAVDSMEDLKTNYTTLLEYFGEDEKMASTDFFGTINKFVAAFTAAAEQVERAEKKRLKEKLRAAAKVAALANVVSKTKSKVLNRPSKGESNAHGITKGIAAFATQKAKKLRSTSREGKTSQKAPEQRDEEKRSGGIPATDVEKMEKETKARGADNRLSDGDAPAINGEDESKRPPLGLGNIAAAAAASAIARQKEPRGEDSEPSEVGVAAGAAGMNPDDKDITVLTKKPADKETTPLAAEAIASAAAAAAALRPKAAKDASTPCIAQASEIPNVDIVEGGAGTSHNENDIAQAATKLANSESALPVGRLKREESRADDQAGEAAETDGAKGSIAAAAAAAALTRQKKAGRTDAETSKLIVGAGPAEANADDSKDITLVSETATLEGGGIASAAAAAAVLRLKALNEGNMQGHDPQTEGVESDHVAVGHDEDTKVAPAGEDGSTCAVTGGATNRNPDLHDETSGVGECEVLDEPVPVPAPSGDSVIVTNEMSAATRESEAVALASEALARSDYGSTVSRDLAALASAARQDEAVALASIALEGSEGNQKSSKDAAASTSAMRQNEVAATIAAALETSRKERELSAMEAKASKPTRQSDAASAIAAALAASKQVREESMDNSAPPKGDTLDDVQSALAAARAAVRLKRKDSNQSVKATSEVASTISTAPINMDLPASPSALKKKLSNKVDFSQDTLRRSDDDISSIRLNADVGVVKRGSSETMTDDLAELLKARMAIRSARQTIRNSNAGQVIHDKIPLRPSDVKKSAEGTGSRVDANSLLWDDGSDGYNNDLSAILWDNDDESENASESILDESDSNNPIKQWFRESMSTDLDE